MWSVWADTKCWKFPSSLQCKQHKCLYLWQCVYTSSVVQPGMASSHQCHVVPVPGDPVHTCQSLPTCHHQNISTNGDVLQFVCKSSLFASHSDWMLTKVMMLDCCRALGQQVSCQTIFVVAGMSHVRNLTTDIWPDGLECGILYQQLVDNSQTV